jgi:hypothetical protein
VAQGVAHTQTPEETKRVLEGKHREIPRKKDLEGGCASDAIAPTKLSSSRCKEGATVDVVSRNTGLSKGYNPAIETTLRMMVQRRKGTYMETRQAE